MPDVDKEQEDEEESERERGRGRESSRRVRGRGQRRMGPGGWQLLMKFPVNVWTQNTAMATLTRILRGCGPQLTVAWGVACGSTKLLVKPVCQQEKERQRPRERDIGEESR